MEYEVYEDPGAGWGWRASEGGHTIILATGHASREDAQRHLAEHNALTPRVRINRPTLKKTPSMTKKARIAFLLTATIFAMGLIGIVFKYKVQPQQAVWDTSRPPVHWERSLVPLKVGGAYPKALKEAVSLWNGQTDCDLFQLSDNPLIAVEQRTIEVGSKGEDWGAGAFVNRDTTWGRIEVYIPLMVGTDLRVIHHELGHILGLAHDRSYTMKPIVKEEIGGAQVLVRAQDKDIDALNARYCAEPGDK